MRRIKSKFEEKTFEPLCSFSVKKYQLNIAKKKKKKPKYSCYSNKKKQKYK